MQYIIRIPIGDWSGDGHNYSEDFYILSNYDVSTLRQAYKDSCKLMGIQFNSCDDFTGLKDCEDYECRHICTDYECSSFSNIVGEVLGNFNFPFKDILENKGFDNIEEFVVTLLWFISKSMPEDFIWEKLKFETLNGYWNKELNVQFGYGLFRE